MVLVELRLDLNRTCKGLKPHGTNADKVDFSNLGSKMFIRLKHRENLFEVLEHLLDDVIIQTLFPLNLLLAKAILNGQHSSVQVSDLPLLRIVELVESLDDATLFRLKDRHLGLVSGNSLLYFRLEVLILQLKQHHLVLKVLQIEQVFITLCLKFQVADGDLKGFLQLV